MCLIHDRQRLRSIARKYERLRGSNDSDINVEDHFLPVAQNNRKLFKIFASLAVPDTLHNSPKVEKILDLIQVKQLGSSAVAAQIQAILSYSPPSKEVLEEYPKYGERILKLVEFIHDHHPSDVCHI